MYCEEELLFKQRRLKNRLENFILKKNKDKIKEISNFMKID